MKTKKLFLFTIFGLVVNLQVSYPAHSASTNLEYYQDRAAKSIPKGTKIVFEKELVIASGTTTTHLTNLCKFEISPRLKQEYDQIIAPNTEKEIIQPDPQDFPKGIPDGVFLSSNPMTYFSCHYFGRLTIGQLVTELRGNISFHFPTPGEPQKFKFP